MYTPCCDKSVPSIPLGDMPTTLKWTCPKCDTNYGVHASKKLTRSEGDNKVGYRTIEFERIA